MGEYGHLRVKNWDNYQHYKDRNPPWIKLHKDLLTSRHWIIANDHQRVLLITVMLLAARDDNAIEADPVYIKVVGRLDEDPDLDWLISSGFCEWCDEDDAWENPWASRSISAELRSQILSRDGNKCVFCEAEETLEIDHIIPVSKGGDSNPRNLQVLCRSCNRKKRARVANATRSVAPATQGCVAAEPNAEAEGETEKRERGATEPRRNSHRFVPPSVAEVSEYINEKDYSVDANRFVDFYKSKGWLVGKNKMRDWKASVRTWDSKERERIAKSGSDDENAKLRAMYPPELQ